MPSSEGAKWASGKAVRFVVSPDGSYHSSDPGKPLILSEFVFSSENEDKSYIYFIDLLIYYEAQLK